MALLPAVAVGSERQRSGQKHVPPSDSNVRRAAVGFGDLAGHGQPRPMPSGLPVANGSNSRSAICGGGPGPAVVDAHAWPGRRSPRTRCAPSRRAGRFDGVEHQVQQHLPQLLGIGRQRDVSNRPAVDVAAPLCDAGRPARHELHQLVDDLPQIAIAAAGRLRAAGCQKALANVLRSSSIAAARRPGFPGRFRGNAAGAAARPCGAGRRRCAIDAPVRRSVGPTAPAARSA